jgi:hypothetical protein
VIPLEEEAMVKPKIRKVDACAEDFAKGFGAAKKKILGHGLIAVDFAERLTGEGGSREEGALLMTKAGFFGGEEEAWGMEA